VDAGWCRSGVGFSRQPSRNRHYNNEIDQFTRVAFLVVTFLLFSFLSFPLTGIAQTPALEGRSPTPPHYTVSAAQLRVPSKAWLRLESAHKQFSKGNLAGASREIGRALEVDPACAPAFSMRAFIKLAAKNREGAVEDAEHAVLLDPQDAESFIALAMAHNSLKEFRKGMEAAQHALELRPGSWQGRLEMAKSRYGQSQFVLALGELDAVGKDFPDVHLVRGNVLMSLDRRQEAAEEFDLFLKQEPRDPRSEPIRRIVATVRTSSAKTGTGQK
jgi:tetratricopeptide (TPR) repeat protein